MTNMLQKIHYMHILSVCLSVCLLSLAFCHCTSLIHITQTHTWLLAFTQACPINLCTSTPRHCRIWKAFKPPVCVCRFHIELQPQLQPQFRSLLSLTKPKLFETVSGIFQIEMFNKSTQNALLPRVENVQQPIDWRRKKHFLPTSWLIKHDFSYVLANEKNWVSGFKTGLHLLEFWYPCQWENQCLSHF